jgi:hypothetical protein
VSFFYFSSCERLFNIFSFPFFDSRIKGPILAYFFSPHYAKIISISINLFCLFVCFFSLQYYYASPFHLALPLRSIYRFSYAYIKMSSLTPILRHFFFFAFLLFACKANLSVIFFFAFFSYIHALFYYSLFCTLSDVCTESGWNIIFLFLFFLSHVYHFFSALNRSYIINKGYTAKESFPSSLILSLHLTLFQSESASADLFLLSLVSLHLYATFPHFLVFGCFFLSISSFM